MDQTARRLKKPDAKPSGDPILDGLAVRWDRAAALDARQTAELFDGFLAASIRPEFHAKFRRELYKQTISARFFVPGTLIVDKRSWWEALGDLPANSPITAAAIYYRDSAGYEMHGWLDQAKHLLSDYCDTVARVKVGPATYFVFFSDASGMCHVVRAGA